MSNLIWLSEARTLGIEPCIPRSHGPRVDDRRVLSSIVTGGPGYLGNGS